VIAKILFRLTAILVACVVAFPALADVLVFGGTRGVGLETVRQLRAQGEDVTVMVRESSDLAALNDIDGVTTVVGDAMAMASITAAYASGDFAAVISTLSGNPVVGYAVDSAGSINAIDGAQAAGVKRFVLVSSIGAGDSRGVLPAPALKALAAVLTEKEKAERYLVDSGLNWTIIRPGVLTNKPANGNGVVSLDASVTGIISRAEVARVTVEVVDDESTYGKIYSAIEQK
jgi:uncharacterized protein YbjT (DUF2867 family)